MASERVFEAILSGYERALRWVLTHQRLMLLVTLGTVAINVFLFYKIPKGLFPQQDTGMLMGASEAAQDVSFPSMYERQQRINAVLAADPDVGHYVSFLGNGTTNTGTTFVLLKPMPPRKISADQIINRLRGKLAQVEGAALYLQASQDVRVGGMSARTQYQYTLQDADLDELRTWAPRVTDAMKKLPQLKDVVSDQQSAGLELDVAIDRDTASRLGVTTQAIDDALYDAFGQRQVATNFAPLNEYRVVLEAADRYRMTPDALSSIYVPTINGAQVPLGAIAKVQPGVTALAVTHRGQFPSTTVSFNLAEGISLGQAVDAVGASERSIGTPSGLHAEFQGTAQAFADSLASQPYLIAAALIAVYIVLGMLYENAIHPITILSTLPSAGIGALVALMVLGIDLSVIALIGILLLVGIVKKNAILMIDVALEAQKKEGLSAEEAIFKAASHRFRPILMTTLAALLGALPLALGSGLGSELRKPLGVAIVGGLLASQALTLFTTPVVYVALDKLAFKKNVKRDETTPPQNLSGAAPSP